MLTDCVPSKTLIATSNLMAAMEGTRDLGIRFDHDVSADAAVPPTRPVPLRAQARRRCRTRSPTRRGSTRGSGTWRKPSRPTSACASRGEGVQVISGRARLARPGVVAVGDEEIRADTVLISVGAHPRELPGAIPDGERLLTCRQIYDLPDLPSELIVVGSGVTGAEFASAYQALGSQVTLVSSRDHVLPNEDTDARDGGRRRLPAPRHEGTEPIPGGRRASGRRDGVEVSLQDGTVVTGSHCLLTVGMVPSTTGLGLGEAGVDVDDSGFISVDRVSRTTAPGVYAAGDCTGVWMLASVAAMQGRIAMWHALGEAVQPLRLGHVAATIFTDPEIAAVGASQQDVDSGKVLARVVKLPLATNARAKMDGFSDGFVKLFTRRNSGIVLGGVIVAPMASELILGVSLAVEQQLTVDEIAHTFAVYPSLTGSITEAARQLMQPAEPR